MKHLKMFAVCPRCKRAIRPAEELEEYVNAGNKYCTHCGKAISSALVEALEEINEIRAHHVQPSIS